MEAVKSGLWQTRGAPQSGCGRVGVSPATVDLLNVMHERLERANAAATAPPTIATLAGPRAPV